MQLFAQAAAPVVVKYEPVKRVTKHGDYDQNVAFLFGNDENIFCFELNFTK